MTQKFDALIIGTGQAGPALAARLDKAWRSPSSSTASSAAPASTGPLNRAA